VNRQIENIKKSWDAREKAIKLMLKKGSSIIEIADSFGVHESTLRRQCIRMGIQFSIFEKYDAEWKLKESAVQEMLLKKFSYPEIARKLKISVHVIAKRAKRLKLNNVDDDKPIVKTRWVNDINPFTDRSYEPTI
jgi:transposase